MIEFLSKQTKNIGASAAIIGGLTIISQFLGLVRNKIFATEFGASEILDIYNTAFKIPDMIFLLIGMMVSGSILIPFLEQKEKDGDKKYREFISQVFFSFSALLIFISLVAFIFMPFLIDFFFPGFQGVAQVKLIEISRLILLSPILMGISNIFMSVNQKNNSFVAVAATGVFYNLAIILAIYAFYPIFGINGLAYGVILGSLFYFILQLPSIFKQKLFPKKIGFLNRSDSKKYFFKSLPRSLALFIAAFIPVYLYSQASKMSNGSITMLQFSLSLYFTPIALITTSYSMAIFPKLAKFFVEKKPKDFSNTVSDIISRILFFSIPITFFFIFFAQELVGFFFGSAKFALTEINLTSQLFAILSLVIVVQSLNIMFSRVLYAVRNTSLTMLSNTITLLLIIFVVFLTEKLFPNFDISLIFLVSIFFCSYLLSTTLLFFLTKRKVQNYLQLKNLFVIKKTSITLISVLLARIVVGLPQINIQQTFFQYLTTLLIAVFLCLVIFIILSEFFQEKNYLDFKKKILKLLKRKR